MSKFEQLRAEVDSLIRESDPYGINIDGFWETFEKTYHYKPDPRDFAKQSLTTILDLFPNLTKVRRKHPKRKGKTAIYVCLKQEEIGRKEQRDPSTSQKETLKISKEKDRPKSSKAKGNVVKASARKQNDDASVTSFSVKPSSQTVTQRVKEKSVGETSSDANSHTGSQVQVSRQESKTTKKVDRVVKSDTTMSKDSKFMKEMEDKGFIFHTYGRDRSSSRDSSEQRNLSGEQQGRKSSQGQSRLPLWLSASDGRDSSNLQSPIPQNATSSKPSQQMDFTFGGYSMMPMSAASPAIPLVYGMNFPSLGEVSTMLSQAGGKSTKQLQKQQIQNAQSEAFISFGAREERSSIANPPPPRQYKEPPSASAIAAEATSEASERSSKSKKPSYQHSYGRPGKNTIHVSKEELDRVAADCIDRYTSFFAFRKVCDKYYLN